MIQINPLLSVGTVDIARPAGIFPTMTSDFALALAQLGVPAGDAAPVLPPGTMPIKVTVPQLPELPVVRQDLAATGTILPVETVEAPVDAPIEDANALPIELLAAPAPVIVAVKPKPVVAAPQPETAEVPVAPAAPQVVLPEAVESEETPIDRPVSRKAKSAPTPVTVAIVDMPVPVVPAAPQVVTAESAPQRAPVIVAAPSIVGQQQPAPVVAGTVEAPQQPAPEVVAETKPAQVVRPESEALPDVKIELPKPKLAQTVPTEKAADPIVQPLRTPIPTTAEPTIVAPQPKPEARVDPVVAQSIAAAVPPRVERAPVVPQVSVPSAVIQPAPQIAPAVPAAAPVVPVQQVAQPAPVATPVIAVAPIAAPVTPIAAAASPVTPIAAPAAAPTQPTTVPQEAQQQAAAPLHRAPTAQLVAAPQVQQQVAAQAMFDGGQPGGSQRDDRGDTPEAVITPIHNVTTQPAAQPVAQVTAPQPPLDLARRDWMEGMIDRIETIQSEGGARETRIRLTPDALGSIDVSITHDEGGVRVHIAADSAQARAMLAEAAPRLTEMAESRGLKLAQANVDPGAAGTGQGQRDTRQPEAPVPTRPASARTAANDDDGAETDSRLA